MNEHDEVAEAAGQMTAAIAGRDLGTIRSDFRYRCVSTAARRHVALRDGDVELE